MQENTLPFISFLALFFNKYVKHYTQDNTNSDSGFSLTSVYIILSLQICVQKQ